VIGGWGWGLGIGDRGLGIGGWGLGVLSSEGILNFHTEDHLPRT
jgi:hypothetical protein